MSSTGTRPPLFDPEPGSFDKDVDSPRFPRKRSRGVPSNKEPDHHGKRNDSPAWVRPFIFGGLILVAILSLFSFLGGQDPDPGPTAQQDDVEEPQADEGVEPAAPDLSPANEQDASAVGASSRPEIPVASQDPPAPAEADQPGTAQAAALPGASSNIPELQGATAFAVQFAHDYLNFDESNPDIRERNLRNYLAPGLDGQLGWNGEGVQLAVLTVPVDTVSTESRVTITVAAQITGKDSPRWVHLSVPLVADESGRWAVITQPSYVPRPAPGAVDPATEPSVDDALTEELQPVITRFFSAFAEESTVQLDGITTPGGAIPGLRGLFTLDAVKKVTVSDGDGEERTARARVTWQDDITGTTVDQTYTLTLVQQDGEWLIDQIGTG
ncbi:hypothetical protein BH24ACT15_BH24ACT15_16370 [soil metagenome]